VRDRALCRQAVSRIFAYDLGDYACKCRGAPRFRVDMRLLLVSTRDTSGSLAPVLHHVAVRMTSRARCRRNGIPPRPSSFIKSQGYEIVARRKCQSNEHAYKSVFEVKKKRKKIFDFRPKRDMGSLTPQA